jgi:hypothetical protein
MYFKFGVYPVLFELLISIIIPATTIPTLHFNSKKEKKNQIIFNLKTNQAIGASVPQVLYP